MRMMGLAARMLHGAPSGRAEPVEARAPSPTVRAELVEAGDGVLAACLGEGRGPGIRPGGRVTFFRVAERKSPKKGRPYCARPFAALRATCDARTGGAPQNSLRATRSVQTTAASQCTKCVCPSAHARTPCPALLGTRRREPQTDTSTRAIASLRCARPRLAGASATRCAVGAERGDGPRGCSAVGCLAPHPCWLRLRRGGCGVARASERACFVL